MTLLDRAATWLLAGALLMLPFECGTLSIPIAGVRITVPEALAGVAILCAAASVLANRGAAVANVSWSLPVAATAFALAYFASAMFAVSDSGSALKFAIRMAAGAAFGVAVYWCCRRNPRAARVLLGGFALGVAAAVGIAIVEWLAPMKIDPFLDNFREVATLAAGIPRVGSTYGYPNTLATSIAMAMPLMAATAAGPSRWRFAAVAVFAISVVALVVTYSRGGVIAAITGLAFLVLDRYRRGGSRQVALPAAFIGVIVLAWTAAWLGAGQLARRASIGGDEALLAARIVPAERELATSPGTIGTMQIEVTNTGTIAWIGSPDAPFTLEAEWFDDSGARVVAEGARTYLPPHVEPSETVAVKAFYTAPDATGPLWLVWGVVIENRVRLNQLSTRRAAVRVISTKTAPAGAAPPSPTTPAAAPSFPPAIEPVPAQVSRLDLWRAALAMFRERPIAGLGPDSFRMNYGRYLGLSKWDVRVFANNLYLEVLATTGLIGLASLAGVVIAVLLAWRRRLRDDDCAGYTIASVAMAAFAVVLVHGLVDCFLAFTAGYLPFWLFAGVVCAAGDRVARKAF